MKIEISGEECVKILQDYAFSNFGGLMGCEKIEDMEIEIDCNYHDIEKMEITKKDPEVKTESEG